LPLLVEPSWLEPRLHDPLVRVIDASWYLPAMRRDARAEYAAAHVPGAVFLDLSSDLADEKAPLRNTVAAPERLARTFAARGIGTDHRVVVYDRLGGYSAGRIWWTLRYAGHSNVSLLDGGFARWQAEGRPVTSESPRHPTARFTAAPRPELLRSKADVLRVVREGGAEIVDARSAARFRGTGEEHTRRTGHIPGSRSVPYDQNLSGDPPRLKSTAELRAAYERAGVRLDRPIIATCGSGVTAALDAFALALLGHTDVSVYDGSWAEWGDADDVPIATGDT
jgi:thiosulfate/3-mercaptopyruvate sulfurtransferase